VLNKKNMKVRGNSTLKNKDINLLESYGKITPLLNSSSRNNDDDGTMHFGSQLSARNNRKKSDLRRTNIKVVNPKLANQKSKKDKSVKRELKCIPIKIWDGLTMESVHVTPRKLKGFSIANDDSSNERTRSDNMNASFE